jgi:hypothetical protein
MKGSATAFGGILAVLLISAFCVGYIIGQGNISGSIAIVEGNSIAFANKAFFLMKNFNQSIEFLSQRIAYELGLNGGFSQETFWTTESPTTDELKQELEEEILKKFPNDFGRVTWTDSSLEVTPCENLNCFNVSGYAIFVLYNSDSDTKIEVNNSFDQTIQSSYFRLLNVAREIVDNGDYELKQSYGLKTGVSENIITITDDTCLPEHYCLAPLKSTEDRVNINGEDVLYDYLKLKFKIPAAV